MAAKILHIASFVGNVGDNASHMGLDNILSGICEEQPVIERLEIRRFYKKYQLSDKLSFDDEFARYANSFDGVVVGGGGFLDYWVPGSSTGTTLDITPRVMSKIKSPLLISSVGALPHQDIPEGNVSRFRSFLDVVLSQENISIGLRNDGSYENIKNTFGAQYSDAVHQILDNAFFYSTPCGERIVDREYVAINLAPDQLGMLSNMMGVIDEELFYQEVRRVVEYCIEELSLHVVLIPHIQADLKAIVRLLDSLESFTARTKVSVAPCIQRNSGADKILSIYQNSRFVIASRFHANVCSIAMMKPTVGIAVLDRVGFMYDSIGRQDSYALPGESLADELIHKIAKNTSANVLSDAFNDELRQLKSNSLAFYEEKIGLMLN